MVDGPKVIRTNPYLQNEEAVYLVSPNRRLRFKTRVPIKRNMKFHDNNWSLEHQAIYACAPGADHWAGIVAVFP